MSEIRPWLLYGAYGYTGKLIARAATGQGVRLLLSGRREDPLAELAKPLGLPWRRLDLDNRARLVESLQDCAGVLNCAGPFVRTAAPMIGACIAARRPYLDITGEIEVFEFCHSKDDEARAAGIPLCPGVGFDVVPTDCLAAVLEQALPAAQALALGFDALQRISPGTARTMTAGIKDGGCIRRDGRLVRVPLGWHTRRIDFGSGEKLAVTIPWGDVATAYYSTGIGNVRVYAPASPRSVKHMQRINWLRYLLRIPALRDFMENQAAARTRGPNGEELDKGRTHVWGEACTAQGECIVGTLETPNGYALTRDSALEAIRRLSDQPPDRGGYYTPSLLFGTRFVETLPGVGAIKIERRLPLSREQQPL